MVAMGRSLLADPELPNKAAQNRIDQIRPCVGCCLGCIHAVLALEPGGCVVNPDVGREFQLKDETRTDTPLDILIIGAGPAGLAAARMAALRGHRPVVVDSRKAPGGLLHLAAKPPGRSGLQEIIDFYVRELARLKVPLHLETRMDEKRFEALNPRVVLVASGSLPKMPMIKGLFQTGMAIGTVVEVLEGKADMKEKVVVLGGGQTGLVTADFLAEQGKTVVVLNRRSHFAEEMSANDRFYLRERLKRQPVTLYKDVTVEGFTADGVRFRHAGGREDLSGFDSVVIAETGEPVRETVNFLKKSAASVQIIGDAKSARHLMFAISEGEEAARAV